MKKQKIKVRIHTPHRIIHYSDVIEVTKKELENLYKVLEKDEGNLRFMDSDGQELFFAPALLSQCVKTIIYMDKDQD